MKRFCGCSLFLSLVMLGAVIPAASESKGASDEVPVFRSAARRVLVDVIAKDANGKPIQGLKAEDFTVFDNGKPQTIRSLDEHRGSAAPQPSGHLEEAPPELPVGVYTNWQPVPKSGSVNIILFDSLNTRWEDQAYARMQLVKFLQTIPPGQQIALYTLGDHLRIIQSFSGRSDTLIAAAKKLGAVSKLDGINRGREADSMAGLKTTTTGIGPSGPSIPAGAHSSSVLDQLESFLQEETSAIDYRRAVSTLEALRELARSVAAVPGRKNLIWISGGFPLTIGTFTERSQPRIYDGELRKTTALLAAHQIAIYPVDARGLLTGLVGAERTGLQVVQTTAGDAAFGQKQQLRQFSNELLRAHTVMDELAEQTGGRAFYNTNGLSTAITNSIDEGSNYYTIAYTPPSKDKDWDGRLRKITVKTSRMDVTLLYRRGYYAIADPFAPVLKIKTTDQDVQKRLIEAVQPNSPQLNSLLMKAEARLLPTTDKGTPIEVDYVMDASGFTFPVEEETGKRNLRYQLVVVAWNDEEKNAGQAWQMLNVDLPPEGITQTLQDGIRSKRLLTLTPGMYQVYVGVIDENSKKVGTVVIPVKVPKRKG